MPASQQPRNTHDQFRAAPPCTSSRSPVSKRYAPKIHSRGAAARMDFRRVSFADRAAAARAWRSRAKLVMGVSGLLAGRHSDCFLGGTEPGPVALTRAALVLSGRNGRQLLCDGRGGAIDRKSVV